MTREIGAFFFSFFLFSIAGGEEYFDPHNHLNGILPFEAYANLPTYMEKGTSGIKDGDLRALYVAIRSWDPTKMAALGSELYSPKQRFGLGARLVLQDVPVTAPTPAVKGALERILTATPWTEFDSAYAFRGDPTDQYLAKNFYQGDGTLEKKAILEAIDLELSRTHISQSEQSMSFVGGWNFKEGKSGSFNTVKFFMAASQDPLLRQKLGNKIPDVKIILMTHAAELGTAPDHKDFICYTPKGWGKVSLDKLETGPEVVYNALIGKDYNRGKPGSVVEDKDLMSFFNTVAGIDTAGAELEEMTGLGMDLYKKYVMAVYKAAKYRRGLNWKGKLLVHTHVGEGGNLYRLKEGSFDDSFFTFPETLSSQAKMESNISEILRAISDLEKNTPDLLDYVVFRLGHVTWATPKQAELMAKDQVEADVNLQSNVATGAYPLSRMPESQIQMKEVLGPILSSENKNWKLNDLLGSLIPPGREDDVEKVGEILGNASLKYLLEYHVPVLLGTDGGGVEHSDIKREYALGRSLIAYWKKHDPVFLSQAPNSGLDTFFNAVKWHLKNMGENNAVIFSN